MVPKPNLFTPDKRNFLLCVSPSRMMLKEVIAAHYVVHNMLLVAGVFFFLSSRTFSIALNEIQAMIFILFDNMKCK